MIDPNRVVRVSACFESLRPCPGFPNTRSNTSRLTNGSAQLSGTNPFSLLERAALQHLILSESVKVETYHRTASGKAGFVVKTRCHKDPAGNRNDSNRYSMTKREALRFSSSCPHPGDSASLRFRMTLKNLLQHWCGVLPRPGRPARSNARSSNTTEALEKRLVLSSFYISPNGDDTNTGSLVAPFASIARGMEAAQPGDSVLLRAGTYRETISSVRSGTAEQPITVESYNGEEVFVSGADVVEGPWTETTPGSGIYSTLVTGRLPSTFWTSPSALANGSSLIQSDGKLVATIANESPFTSRVTRSVSSSDAWNFFSEPVSWKVRGLSFSSVGTTNLPLARANAHFSVTSTNSSSYSTEDSVNVRFKGDGQLTLLLSKDTPNSWGTSAGAVTDTSISGFDLTLEPGSPGNVDYTLTAFPSGQTVATGSWAMTQADWSDGGDGSQSYVQIQAQEGETANVDPTQKVEFSVDSYEISVSGQTILNDHFDDSDLATVSGANPLEVPETVLTPGGAVNVTSGYDQVFVDGEMQHEARHTNKVSTDLLEPDAANISINNSYRASSSAYSGKPVDYFAGARFLARAGQGWSWQASVVESSSGNQLNLDETRSSTPWWPNQNNKSSASGIGYVFGKLDFLDTDGEWHLQYNPSGADTLYLRVAAGANPASHLVERKARNWTIDVGHDYIEISGLNLRGGAVRFNGSDNILAESDARYLSHFQTMQQGLQVDGGFAQGGGVVVTGTNNTVRGNSIYDTAGSGVLVEGSNNLITRNHIYNIDYSGTYGAGLSLIGNGHTATFNTIHDTGRDGLRPTGAGQTIMFNDLSRAGRMAHDGGLTYAWGIDGLDPVTGKSTRIAYNWIHELGDPTDQFSQGIYLDNYTKNFIIDHNVVWDIGLTLNSQRGITLNAPNSGNRLYHNTLIGAPSYNSGAWTPFPDNAPNSIDWTSATHGTDYIGQNNLVLPANADFAAEFVDFAGRDFRPASGSAAIDPTTTTGLIDWATTNGSTNVPPSFDLNMRYKNQPFFYRETTGEGVAVAGINDGFVGTTPDTGAYEVGVDRWTAGVDGASPATLTITVDRDAVREGISTTGTVTRSFGTWGDLTVAIVSSDVTEVSVPATVTIPHGATSVTFSITALNDGITDGSRPVTITASASEHADGSINIAVEDRLAHRMSNLAVRVQDQFGNPLPDATIDVSMTRHAFQFGTQVQDQFLSITEAEFEALQIWQRHNLIGDWNRVLPTPVWQDAVNYRTAVWRNFNHIIPTNRMQWIQYRNDGPIHLDRSIAEAHSRNITVTGHAVVWQNDGWPTPTEFRPAANPDAQEFHDALIADRLSTTGIMTRFSDAGDGPNVLDWDVLNEPLHETHYSNVFVAGGIYANAKAAFADYFIKADSLRPDANLAVNDYNILSSGGDAAAMQYRDLVNDLLALGAPIDQIKVQAHMARMVTKADITRRLDILAETGLPIAISEFDMRDDGNQISPANQKRLFEDMLEAIFEHPAVTGFSMWGIWDSAHWRGNGPLFDSDWNIKDEASPWFDLVQGEWKTSLTDVDVDGSGEWFSPNGMFNGTYDIVGTYDGLLGRVSDYDLSKDGEVVVTIILPPADLAGTSFDAVSDHIPAGSTDVILSIKNRGYQAAGAFHSHLVWSTNEFVGDADDIIIAGSGENYTGLAASASVSRTVHISLDKAELFAHAIATTPSGSPVGSLSADNSRLFLVIDTANAVSETDEGNNSGVGHLIDSDGITYFPWDKNGNGTVEPLEALTSIQSIGTNDLASDFDGNGIVTPLEALSAVERIGYVRASVLSKASNSASALLRSPLKVLQHVEIASKSPLPSFSAPWNDDDDEETLLFPVASTDEPESMWALTDSSPLSSAEAFAGTAWLDVI